jgi:hypothetical protein
VLRSTANTLSVEVVFGAPLRLDVLPERAHQLTELHVFSREDSHMEHQHAT